MSNITALSIDTILQNRPTPTKMTKDIFKIDPNLTQTFTPSQSNLRSRSTHIFYLEMLLERNFKLRNSIIP